MTVRNLADLPNPKVADYFDGHPDASLRGLFRVGQGITLHGANGSSRGRIAEVRDRSVVVERMTDYGRATGETHRLTLERAGGKVVGLVNNTVAGRIRAGF